MAKNMNKKEIEKIMQENDDLKGSLRAFGRFQKIIEQQEHQLQEIGFSTRVYEEYCKDLGGTLEGYKKKYEEMALEAAKMAQDIMKQRQADVNLKDGGAPDILDLSGKPLKKKLEGKE